MGDVETGKISVRAEGARALASYLEEAIRTGRLREGVKLPAERELSEEFGASRGAVRRVLADLKGRGFITQVVGSGTFVLPQKDVAAAAVRVEAQNAQVMHGAQEVVQTSPAELMEARLLIEPLMPGLIVRYATAADFARMVECIERSEAAQSIEEFEKWDGELHKTFALATHNSFFLRVLELTNEVREQGEWGRLKRKSLTAERRAEYEAQHRAIVDALRDRDADLACELLTGHLKQIRHNLFGG
ncbi:MAG: FadR/GntR family transcriptional regulator [Paraburkholderia graminis]|uniref:DNA-binding FadR family transcriptional regulator n=1 Tax=Paraburkholderia graminis TaxID=60548 RepID=A0ABD5CGM8_9BURK|nr:FCD domain-containing protein [Paraburkholderia graminis]MDR6204208.1 DNA-binding FadR family transcriptional regulator [Paraburkholderia graminis]